VTLDPTKEELEALAKRFPNTRFPERPRIEQKIDPLLVQRFDNSMFTPEQRAAAAAELAPEIQAPPGLDASHPAFAAFKRAVAATPGMDNATATRLLAQYARELNGGG